PRSTLFPYTTLFRSDPTPSSGDPLRLGGGEAEAADERNVRNLAGILGARPAVRELADDEQLLPRGGTDRDHEAPARRELRHERVRHLRCGRRHEDGVVRGMLAPAVRAVENFVGDVRDAERLQEENGPFPQRCDALEREEPARETREDGGLIARAGPDLEDSRGRRQGR